MERESKETFDLRIGRLWVISDSFITDQNSGEKVECRETKSNANLSSIVQIEQFIVHFSTASASTIIATGPIQLYSAASPTSQPPPCCPFFVTKLWRQFRLCLPQNSSSCPKKSCPKKSSSVDTVVWMLCGMTDRIAIKIPFSGMTTISVQTGSVFCQWMPCILDLVWVLAEGSYVDFLATRRWALLVIEV